MGTRTTGPLLGRCVVITRPAARSQELVDRLEHFGARVLVTPLVEIVEPVDRGPLLEAARSVGGYDWLLLTSVHGVERFTAALADVGTAVPREVRVCAVGPVTAAALENAGIQVEVVPEEHVGEGLVEALFEAADLRGRRVLYPRAEGARPVIVESLRAAGAEVTDVVAYRTVTDSRHVERLRNALSRGEVDVLAFASGSAVRAFAEVCGANVGRALVASIGPITTDVARGLGFDVAIEAKTYTGAGLASAIADWFRASDGEPDPGTV